LQAEIAAKALTGIKMDTKHILEAYTVEEYDKKFNFVQLIESIKEITPQEIFHWKLSNN